MSSQINHDLRMRIGKEGGVGTKDRKIIQTIVEPIEQRLVFLRIQRLCLGSFPFGTSVRRCVAIKIENAACVVINRGRCTEYKAILLPDDPPEAVLFAQNIQFAKAKMEKSTFNSMHSVDLKLQTLDAM